MKRFILFFFLICFFECSFAQTVAVNTTGNTGNASSMPDISSANKGLLIPMLSTSQIKAIVNPPLVKAVQEQQQIETQKSMIEELKSQNAEMLKCIEALEQK